ncbi:hypothetical protein LLG46_01225 [bacterium]|nr:hypothetical protein [bacterium]
MSLSTLFIIAVTTSRMVFPGVPAYIPSQSDQVPETSPAVRSITMELYSSNSITAPEVSVTLPEGLKLSKTARMQVTPFEQPSQSQSMDKVTVKTYWGSSEAIQTGQPSVNQISTVCETDQVNYKTAALWPGRGKGFEAGPISDDASAVGTYKLTTNYTGSTSVTLGAAQNFLAPIELADPGKDIDIEKSIKLEWKAVVGALAYWVVAYGGNESETIAWTAGSASGADVNIDTALSHNDVTKMLEQKALIGPDVTSTTIPAGIFKGSTGVMFNITAIGEDIIQEKDGIKTQVIVRSTACAPLYSSKYAKPKQDSQESLPAPPQK